ncbi:siderophore-interacting protein [Thaumasiovibrio subtropicus]|uniref:siderophore-interacting protein n=1 Tax=Thaumasiovibrio subtropicus TaxID=1891207 RepID=UPI000B350DE9|nr:siderophore-interacting protein [Thaumasiovibrio subtropicus]
MSDAEAPQRVRPSLLAFVRKEQISPNLVRIILSGDDLIGFPEDKNGAHVKLFLPNQVSGILELPTKEGDKIIWPEHKPVSRAYTVRYYDPEVNELAIDFVTHGKATPGGGWAQNAKEGSTLGLAGPGGPDPLLAPADWHVIAVDLTAVPAVSAILESLPADTRGHVLIEVDDLADKHDFAKPDGMTITWLESRPRDSVSPLVQAIDGLQKPSDAKTVSAFVAGESRSVIACRDKLKADYKLTRKNMYAIPYWRRGQDEETYHQERHTIMDQEY